MTESIQSAAAEALGHAPGKAGKATARSAKHAKVEVKEKFSSLLHLHEAHSQHPDPTEARTATAEGRHHTRDHRAHDERKRRPADPVATVAVAVPAVAAAPSHHIKGERKPEQNAAALARPTGPVVERGHVSPGHTPAGHAPVRGAHPGRSTVPAAQTANGPAAKAAAQEPSEFAGHMTGAPAVAQPASPHSPLPGAPGRPEAPVRGLPAPTPSVSSTLTPTAQHRAQKHDAPAGPSSAAPAAAAAAPAPAQAAQPSTPVAPAAPRTPISQQAFLLVERAAGQQVSQAELVLQPASLGSMSVTLRVEDDGIHAVLHASQAGVEHLLQEQLDNLMAQLTSAGLDVASLDVRSGNGDAAPDNSRGGARRGRSVQLTEAAAADGTKPRAAALAHGVGTNLDLFI